MTTDGSDGELTLVLRDIKLTILGARNGTAASVRPVILTTVKHIMDLRGRFHDELIIEAHRSVIDPDVIMGAVNFIDDLTLEKLKAVEIIFGITIEVKDEWSEEDLAHMSATGGRFEEEPAFNGRTFHSFHPSP